MSRTYGEIRDSVSFPINARADVTFRISFIMSAGSIELVVFMDQVKRSERGLMSPMVPLAVRLSLVVNPAPSAVVGLVLLRSAGRRYDDDALAMLPPIADMLFPIVPPVVVDDIPDSRMDFLDNGDKSNMKSTKGNEKGEGEEFQLPRQR